MTAAALETSATPPITFVPGDQGKFGRGLVHFRHGFNETGLFGDEQLADLIDGYPREYYMITTMTEAGGKAVWRNGDFDRASGKEVLAAIREGRLWLCLRRLDLIAPAYQQLVDNAFQQAELLDPMLKTSQHKSSLLISSPGARVLYHADIPMVALWHIRGRKRLWLYDAENPRHLPDTVLEGVILRETEEEIPYDPAWDAEAKAIDLEPGWAASWPQNAPHRVDNLDGLNVSITTDYFTPEARRKYGVYFANGMLRRRFGIAPRSTRSDGIGALAKCATALAMKKAGLHRQNEREMIKSFVLDRARPGHIVELPPAEQGPIMQA